MAIRGETDEGRARRLKGSAEGSAIIAQRFAAVLGRKAFAERVGLSRVTLRKWEELGVVEPRLVDVGGVQTYVFSERDVERALAIRQLLRDNLGRMSLIEAGEEIDRRSRRRKKP